MQDTIHNDTKCKSDSDYARDCLLNLEICVPFYFSLVNSKTYIRVICFIVIDIQRGHIVSLLKVWTWSLMRNRSSITSRYTRAKYGLKGKSNRRYPLREICRNT